MNLKPFGLLVPALVFSSIAGAGGAGSPATEPPAMPGTVSLGGCVPGFVQPSPAALSRQLAAARVRWQQSRIQDYSFVFDQIAQPVRFSPARISVTATGDIGVTSTGEASAFARTATVPTLFANIAQSIAFARRQPCAELKVKYAQDGHPLSLMLERRDVNIADGGASWTLSNFKRLK